MELNSEKLPTVAVAIPCYNAENWVARAIQSVLDQDYPKLELLVVDDGSRDCSLKVIKSFGAKLRWETGSNRGGCAARNRGLELSDSDFILFLDADDYIEGPLIGEMARTAKRLSLDLAIGISCTERNNTKVDVHSYPVESSRDDILRGWLTGRYVQTGALMWRSAFLRGIGGWDLRVRRSQDIELVLRAILSGAKVKATTFGTTVWCDHSSDRRVGRNHSEEALASEYDFHIRLLEIHSELTEVWSREMAIRFYSIASEAYLYGHDIIGDNALHEARRLGLKGHTGSVHHQLLSAILGLRTKQRLARSIK